MFPVVEPGRQRVPPRKRAMLVNTRSRDSRRALTQAAFQLWSTGDFERAYETITPAEIARVAGVSRGTFYFHFANKDELLLEMGSDLVEVLITEVDAGIARGERLFPLVERVMTSMARRVAHAPRGAVVRSAALGFQVRLGERATLGSRQIGSAFEALVRYGKDRGELSTDTDVEDAAAMLQSVSVEAIMRWGIGDRSGSWLRQALCRRAAIILDGLALLSPPGP
jgi:AcrR family transcriptional regulator